PCRMIKLRYAALTLNLPTPRRSPKTAEPAAGAQAPTASGIVCDVCGAPGGIRTHTEWILSPSTLPLVYRGLPLRSRVPITLRTTAPDVGVLAGQGEGKGFVAETQAGAVRRRVLIAEDEALIRLDL